MGLASPLCQASVRGEHNTGMHDSIFSVQSWPQCASRGVCFQNCGSNIWSICSPFQLFPERSVGILILESSFGRLGFRAVHGSCLICILRYLPNLDPCWVTSPLAFLCGALHHL